MDGIVVFGCYPRCRCTVSDKKTPVAVSPGVGVGLFERSCKFQGRHTGCLKRPCQKSKVTCHFCLFVCVRCGRKREPYVFFALSKTNETGRSG